MSRFKIAHLREQDQDDMIVVPLDAAFGRCSQRERTDFIDALQA